MDDRPVNITLSDSSHIETPASESLRLKALDLLEPSTASDDLSQLPSALLDLLTQIIKPLFSSQHHKKLTSTGRKNLVNNALPSTITRFGLSVFEDNRPAWKTGWTSSLLRHILMRYQDVDVKVRRKVLEEHFYLLVPPILHLIDDIEIVYKCAGCQCLRILCERLYEVESEILKRSGLTDAFVDAMKNDFSLLPTLAAEEDSLALFREMYPAYRALVRARFPGTVEVVSGEATGDGAKNGKGTVVSHLPAVEEDLRVGYLTTLFRHQLLYGLNHLSTGSGLGSTSSVPLSTFLISQIGWVFTDMGASAVVHLRTILPLLRNVLSDPFATSAPEILIEATKALQKIVCTCWPRIREKWWGEVLRGAVECWLNIHDDLKDVKDKKRMQGLREVQKQLRILVALLGDVVDAGFGGLKQRLIGENEVLSELFDGISGSG